MLFKRIKRAVSEAVNPERQCCFCGEVISDQNPIGITLDLGDESTQHMWSHAACLSSKLHDTVPFIAPDDSNDW